MVLACWHLQCSCPCRSQIHIFHLLEACQCHCVPQACSMLHCCLGPVELSSCHDLGSRMLAAHGFLPAASSSYGWREYVWVL